jgi:hypothetical protein
VIEIVHRQDHPFRKKPAGVGCAVCGRARTHMDHHGTTQSVNQFLSKDIFVYRKMKEAWEARLLDLLTKTGLERADRIVVEGTMCFPTRRAPDQGNHRFLIEKALGDALVAGGILEDDTWDRYEFGGLTYEYRPRESWTRLVLFPMELEQRMAA